MLLLRGSIVLLVALLAACVHVGSGTPPNYVVWRTGLASSAQPNEGYLARARELGFDAVINLAPPQSMGSIAKEGDIVRGQGLVYVGIPVDFDNPTRQDFEQFSSAMKDLENRNVLVHCQANLRGSSFTFLYRVIHEGATASEASPLLTGVWVPNARWSAFIAATLAQYGKSAEIL